ncbi:MAG: hypothetical protein U5L03_14720 [Burkholderiaceae bacterium]|nr:hypothetical protein [Burkholderiaceae bacterium]
MSKLITLLLGLLCLLGAARPALAVSAVNPFGVNVRASGPTTVFLTFQNLDPGEVAVEAFWCGELLPAVAAGNPTLQLPFAVQTTNPCVQSSIYGRLPIKLDRSRQSATGTFTNLTDIMTIPASVARRGFQDAQAGLNSSFFYVRRFSGGVGGDKFVIVTCRMGGGGARVALALLNVRVAFEGERGAAPVLALARGEKPPRFAASIQYNGTGMLKGRWEVVMPGDIEPSDDDLLTDATLPVEQRGRQRRYTLIDRFEVFLPPTGDVTIAGPDPGRLPHHGDGAYKVLLRIEASDDKEATSNTGGGALAIAGGVAGFPMPVLRYFVGSGDTLSALATSPQALPLFSPAADAAIKADQPLEFAWIEPREAGLLRVEVEADSKTVLAALVKPGVARYGAPPWFAPGQKGKTLRWRVVGLDAAGREITRSEWRRLTID